MQISIKFPDTGQAEEFAEMMREANLRGVRVEQEEAEPEPGTLASPDLLPVVTLLLQGGFATAVIHEVFSFLRALTIDKPLERKRLANERLKLEAESRRVEMTVKCGDKEINLNLVAANEEEEKNLIDRLVALNEDC